MEHRWQPLPPASPHKVGALNKHLGINSKLCALLVQRNITTFNQAKAFFRPNLAQLHNPFLMKDMDKAVARINTAIANKEHILIYGDYDVDGTTAVALLYSFLKKHYEHLETYIPDRYKEGYGISYAGIEYAEQKSKTLIIALDCGVKAIKKVDYAKKKGIDFIICDHHRPGEELPNAVAVLDPKRSDCVYPFDELSGCGVGFKLVQALCAQWQLPNTEWEELLDLLAVSIGADIVPIVGENRVLAHFGLKLINEKPRLGFKYLKKIALKEEKVMNISDVVFLIGPRINAAGRIAHGKLAVSLLTTNNEADIAELSTTINQHNENRKQLDKNITLEAIKQVEEQPNYRSQCSTVVFHKDWHKGVIGIVASRLVETFYKPTIVFTESKPGILAGSARSVKGFDVYNALAKCEEHLEQFGGHMYAAGMTLKASDLDAFRNKFETVVAETILPNCKLPEIEIDVVLSLEDFLGSANKNFYKVLKQFAPFGPQNMRPIFKTDNLLDNGSKLVGQDESHLRVVLLDKESNLQVTGIGFSLANKLPMLKEGKPISVLYHLEENYFNGTTSLQLQVIDIRLTEATNQT